jgi:hypothetical protein
VNTPKSTSGPTVELHLGKPPVGDDEKLLAFCLDEFRKMTGREPTPEEIEKSRVEIAAARRSLDSQDDP